MDFLTIPGPTEPDAPWPNPPTTGNWLRLDDGGLVPQDEATARTAGLYVEPAPTPAPAPQEGS